MIFLKVVQAALIGKSPTFRLGSFSLITVFYGGWGSGRSVALVDVRIVGMKDTNGGKL